MKKISEHIRKHALCSIGVVNHETNWSDEFERYMRNRMEIGMLRYGSMNDSGTPRFDNCGSALHRINLYLSTGNKEHLVDAANLCMIEFVRGCCHPKPYFKAEDDGYHTEVKK